MPRDGVAVTSKVDLSGPFFKRDPGKTLRANVRDMVVAVAAEMEKETREQVASHAGSMPAYSGWTWAHIIGRAESQNGREWGTWAVVSANTAGMSTKDAIRTKAAAATIERRWHPFRNVKSGLHRARALVSADLAKGLN